MNTWVVFFFFCLIWGTFTCENDLNKMQTYTAYGKKSFCINPNKEGEKRVHAAWKALLKFEMEKRQKQMQLPWSFPPRSYIARYKVRVCLCKTLTLNIYL